MNLYANKKGRKAKGLAVLLSLVMLLSVLAACSGGGGSSGGTQPADTKAETAGEGAAAGEAAEESPLKLSIMVPSFKTDLPDKNSPVLKELESYTNTDITMQFVPNSSYPDKMNITLASGQLPSIMVVDRTPSFINAARAGAFWELTPYLKDFPNLSQANDVVLTNSSIDGKLYGIYRARTLGRMGLTINKDWLEKVGMEPPKTIDEFYSMLKAFKEQDPDGNGKDDTYGLVVTKYAGPWDIMQVWFGAPNKWGVGEDGKLVPTHMTPEYKEALAFFRKLYEEGLVNEDFAVMDPAVWMDPLVNGQAGAVVDVADMARRIDGRMQDKTERDTSYMSVHQAPVGPKGHRDMPTQGYSSMLAISKSAVKTEEELKRVLKFLDQINDPEMQLLLSYGIEGRHYDMKDGFLVSTVTEADVALVKEYEAMNQMLMFIPQVLPPLEQTDVNKQIEEVYKANEAIIVANPAEPLVSQVYAQKGQQLDNIIADARIKYIVGQLDEKGLDEAIALWRSSGGDEYIAEVNKLYEEANSK